MNVPAKKKPVAKPSSTVSKPRIALVPRLREQGYRTEQVATRRRWIEEKVDCQLKQVGAYSICSEAMRGNIENPIGTVQIPLGVAGPLHVEGEHARGTFYVPLATNEGALVRSYERGMVAITRSGGAQVRVWTDENRVSPIFVLTDVAAARDFAHVVVEQFAELKAQAEATTRHGRLLRVECQPSGREVIVHFTYSTGDAHGMNMIVRATDAACVFLRNHVAGSRYTILSGASSEKRVSGSLFGDGKGKKVTAGVSLGREIVYTILHSTPERLVELGRRTMLGHLHAGALGYNGHIANALTALFIACGQDVANVMNSAVGVTHFSIDNGGDLYASITLPSLTVATVGGGTALGTSAECLGMLGCAGAGKTSKFAEIVAATVLAGELSMAGALISGEFVAAHERYGRNRPSGEVSARSEEPSY